MIKYMIIFMKVKSDIKQKYPTLTCRSFSFIEVLNGLVNFIDVTFACDHESRLEYLERLRSF